MSGDFEPVLRSLPGLNGIAKLRDAGFIKSPPDGFPVSASDSFQDLEDRLSALFPEVFEWMDRDDGSHRQANPAFTVGQAPYMRNLPAFVLGYKEGRSLQVAVCSPFFNGSDVLEFCQDPRKGGYTDCALYLCMCLCCLRIMYWR